MTTDKTHSEVTYSNLSAIPEHENTDYDQVGIICHTLENEEEREEQAMHGTHVDPQTKVHYGVATIVMKECVAYDTIQGKAVMMSTNPAYGDIKLN